MPPRPFPFPLRIGTDIVQTSRIHRLITKGTSSPAPQTDAHHSLNSFLRHLFTFREQALFRQKFASQLKNGAIGSAGVVVQHLSGRWAAKEATIKAIKPRRATFMDVEIVQHPETQGVYALVLDQTSSPKAPEPSSSVTNPQDSNVDAENDPNGQVAQISISHDGEYATAVCLAVESRLPGDVGGEAAARMP